MRSKRKPLAVGFFIALPLVLIAFVYWIALTSTEMEEFERVVREPVGEGINFTILHTNDEHSALLPHSPSPVRGVEERELSVGGFARLATAVSQLREEKRAEEEPVLLISAGDFLGGTPYSWLALQGQAPELELMQDIGYDVITLGNHEFDFGPEALAEYLKNAGYPDAQDETALVASNIVVPEEHPLAQARFKETHIIELDNGLKIGFLGLLGEDALRVIPAELSPVTFQPSIQTARNKVRRLQYQGADVIVAVTHSGLRWDRRLAREVQGIDIIVGGHCHTRLYTPEIENDTVIVQAGSEISHLGILELSYNKLEGTLAIRNQETGRPHLMPIEGSLEAYPTMEERIQTFTRELEDFIDTLTGGRFSQLQEPLVATEEPLTGYYPFRETAVGNFVTDAMRMVVEEKTGERVDFAFQTNGQIRGALGASAADEQKGFISFYDMAKLAGMGIGPDGTPGYPLVSAYLTGKEIIRVMELSSFLSQYMGNSYFLQVSGARYSYNPGLSILFTVPFKNIPIPTGRAVLNAEIYTGDGLQTLSQRDYKALKRGDDELYHVVSGYHILSALPHIGRQLPHLNIVPKNEKGEPIEDLTEAVIRVDGQELKVWQVLAEYATAESSSGAGSSWITGYYASAGNRIQQVRSIPVYILLIILASGLLGFFIVKKAVAAISSCRKILFKKKN